MKTLILARVSGRVSVPGFEITADYRVQLPRAEAEEENSYAGILTCFRGRLDVQGANSVLTKNARQRKVHWPLVLRRCGEREIGVFMALSEVVCLPRFPGN